RQRASLGVAGLRREAVAGAAVAGQLPRGAHPRLLPRPGEPDRPQLDRSRPGQEPPPGDRDRDHGGVGGGEPPVYWAQGKKGRKGTTGTAGTVKAESLLA